MTEWESARRTEAVDWRIQDWLTKMAQGCACEREKEALADWLLEVCLYYAHLERLDDPQEIAVLATERLWQSVENGSLTWRDDSGLCGLMRYIRQAVRFEAGRHRRAVLRDRAVVAPLDDATHLPDPDDLETAVVERLELATADWRRPAQRFSTSARSSSSWCSCGWRGSSRVTSPNWFSSPAPK
jgi:hypothetical protein